MSLGGTFEGTNVISTSVLCEDPGTALRALQGRTHVPLWGWKSRTIEEARFLAEFIPSEVEGLEMTVIPLHIPPRGIASSQ